LVYRLALCQFIHKLGRSPSEADQNKLTRQHGQLNHKINAFYPNAPLFTHLHQDGNADTSFDDNEISSLSDSTSNTNGDEESLGNNPFLDTKDFIEQCLIQLEQIKLSIPSLIGINAYTSSDLTLLVEQEL
jgi:hypothetical protein